MHSTTVTAWRRWFLLAGVAIVIGTWIFTLISEPVAGDGITTALSTTQGTVSWFLFAAATVLFFFAFYGTMPDRVLLCIPGGFFINFAGAGITEVLGLPFYGDTVGTMLSAIIGGPLLGLVTSMLSMLVWSLSNPMMLPHVITAAIVAVVVGYAAVYKRLSTLGRVMGLGLGLGIVAAVMSWISVMLALDGFMFKAQASFADFFVLIHFSETTAQLIQLMVCDPLDKVFSIIFAAVVVRYAPLRVRGYFRYPGNEKRLKRVLRVQEQIDVEDAARLSNESALRAVPVTAKAGIRRSAGSWSARGRR